MFSRFFFRVTVRELLEVAILNVAPLLIVWKLGDAKLTMAHRSGVSQQMVAIAFLCAASFFCHFLGVNTTDRDGRFVKDKSESLSTKRDRSDGMPFACVLLPTFFAARVCGHGLYLDEYECAEKHGSSDSCDDLYVHIYRDISLLWDSIASAVVTCGVALLTHPAYRGSILLRGRRNSIGSFTPEYVLYALLLVPLFLCVHNTLRVGDVDRIEWVYERVEVCSVIILSVLLVATRALDDIRRSKPLGEFCIVAQGVAIFLANVASFLYAKIALNREPTGLFPSTTARTNEVSVATVTLVLFICTVLSLVFVRVGLAIFGLWTASDPDEKKKVTANARRRVSIFLILFVVGLLYIILPTADVLMGASTLQWFSRFVLSKSRTSLYGSARRLLILGFWASALACSLPLIFSIGHSNNKTKPQRRIYLPVLPRIVVRKLFHLLAVLLFLPVVLFDSDFLFLSYAIAVALMSLVEVVRLGAVPWVSPALNRYILLFTDSRDRGRIVLSHFYLLLGCAVPHWFASPYDKDRALLRSSGVLSVGVADAFAAIGGTYFGKTRWPGTSKTMEGTACAIVFAYAASICLCDMASPMPLLLLLAVLSTCLLESFTALMDNVALPIYFFSIFLAMR
eukprot:g1757.t1